MSTGNTETDIQWALDLLAPDPLYEENFISKWFHHITLPSAALGGVAYINYMQGRPFSAGIRRYAIALGVGLISAKVLKDAKTHREAERDAVIRHYIKLHPEDFPPPEKKTFNDVFYEWMPCR